MKKEEKETDNSFALMLGQLAKGRVLAELGEAQRTVIAAVRGTGKKGCLTLKLSYQPVPRTDGEQVEVIEEVKLSLPKPPKPASLFFTTEEGQMSRQNPRQRDWVDELEPVDGGAGADPLPREGRLAGAES